jgi:hypothetical protein
MRPAIRTAEVRADRPEGTVVGHVGVGHSGLAGAAALIVDTRKALQRCKDEHGVRL